MPAVNGLGGIVRIAPGAQAGGVVGPQRVLVPERQVANQGFVTGAVNVAKKINQGGIPRIVAGQVPGVESGGITGSTGVLEGKQRKSG